MDTRAWTIASLADPPPESWLAEHLGAGDRVGFDPWLHTSAAAERLATACAKAGAELVPVESNPVDSIWTDRPAPPLGPVTIHGAKFAGESEADKLTRIRAEMAKLGVDALVLSDSHAVAWTFNIRGADVSHTPLPLSYALVPKDGRPTVFIDARKLSNSARDHLQRNADVHEPNALTPALTDLARTGTTIALDKATAADALSRLITAAGGNPVRGDDPVALLKAVKNPTEDRGHPHRASARRRGAGAVSRLDRPRSAEGHADRNRCRRGAGNLSPRDRRAEGRLLSHDLRHRTERRHRPLPRHPQEQPPHRARRSAADRFRRAIRGRHHRRHAHHRDRHADRRDARSLHARAAAATSPLRVRYFPAAPPARNSIRWRGSSLWQAGLDFEHGTGHGVGSYLSVHEGPARISKLGTTPLKRGMILSNEPGYYKTDAFGIRIENLVLVTAAEISGAEKPMNNFETLTLAPIDRRLIDRRISKKEVMWLNDYHARVRHEVRPHLDEATKIWLDAATEPLPFEDHAPG